MAPQRPDPAETPTASTRAVSASTLSPEAPEPLRPAADFSARYRLLHVLGEGGMGQVWRAHDAHLARDVALKRIRADRRSADTVARFLREARATAQLQHPGVVPLYDLGRLDDGELFYTMQIIEGQTLLDVIHQGADPLRRVALLRRVCETVAYAHSRGIIHRDIKPVNVMIGAFDEVLLVDWGLVKILDEPAPAGGLLGGDALAEQTRIGMGTRGYMAPEQRGATDRPVTAAADVYALGVTLQQLFPAALPAPLRSLAEEATAPLPDARPTAAQLAERLGAWLTGAQTRAQQDARFAAAEAAWATLPPAQRGAARSLLLRLIGPAGAPRPRPRAVLRSGALDALLRAPLVAEQRDTIALDVPASWPRLQDWRAEDPAAHRSLLALVDAAQTWQEGDRSAAALWPAARLRAAGPAGWTTELERSFLAASHRRHARRRGAIGVTVGALALLAAVGVWGWWRDRTEAAEALARAQQQTQTQLYLAQSHLAMRDGAGFEALASLEAAATLSPRSDEIIQARDRLSAQLGTLRVIDAHDQRIWSMAWSPDDAELFTGSADGWVRRWRVSDGALLAERRYGVPVFAVALSPDGETLAIGGADDRLMLWDVAADTTRILAEAWPDAMSQLMAWSPQGRHLAAATTDGGCLLVDAQQGTIQRVDDFSRRAMNTAWRPDGAGFACVGYDKTVTMADLSGEIVWRASLDVALGTAEAGAAFVAISPDGRHVGVAVEERVRGAKSGLVLLDAETGALRRQHRIPGSVGIAEVVFTPDAQRLLAVNRGAPVTVMPTDPTAPISSMGAPATRWEIDAHPTRPEAVTVAADGQAQLWDLRSGENVESLTLLGHVGRHVRYSHRGETIAAASANAGRLWLWSPRVHDATPLVAPTACHRMIGRGVVSLPALDALAYTGASETLCILSGDGTIASMPKPPGGTLKRAASGGLLVSRGAQVWRWQPGAQTLVSVAIPSRNLPEDAYFLGEAGAWMLFRTADRMFSVHKTAATVRETRLLDDVPAKGGNLLPDGVGYLGAISGESRAFQVQGDGAVALGDAFIQPPSAAARSGWARPLFFSGSHDGTVTIKPLNGRPPVQIGGLDSKMTYIALSGDEHHALLMGWSGQYELWQIAPPRQLTRGKIADALNTARLNTNARFALIFTTESHYRLMDVRAGSIWLEPPLRPERADFLSNQMIFQTAGGLWRWPMPREPLSPAASNLRVCPLDGAVIPASGDHTQRGPWADAKRCDG
ncbi:MAG: protein kinase [Myxococcota bacterium]